MPLSEAGRYHIWLDGHGYICEPRSYRIFPAPLMGTRFATGRAAYSNLDFWQIGGMTDFTKGINQLFMVDPSQYYFSQGIDISKEGVFRLEQDLLDTSFPRGVGLPTARYRTEKELYLGTSEGFILRTIDGKNWLVDVSLPDKKAITCFFEFKGASGNDLYACRGAAPVWYKPFGKGWQVLTPVVTNLFFVMAESDYLFGMFDDGIRQSTDAKKWVPEPPDPLWSLPAVEGKALNAMPITRGFMVGTARGLWLFIGGGSGINIWSFSDYYSLNNFRGMARWGIYGIFSVENQGIFYTDGSAVYPTNLNWRALPFSCISCKSIIASGWDIFALVSEGKDWYLARCNLVLHRAPKHWWIVKKLAKEPVFLSSFSFDKIFVHYKDGTCQVYDKEGTNHFQSEGFLESSFLDENMVLLQKFYKDISVISSRFDPDTQIKIGYRTAEDLPYEEETFTTTSLIPSATLTQELKNPTLSNRLQWRVVLKTFNPKKSPLVTDVMWKYFLERPAGEMSYKKMWNFIIIAEDRLEKLDFDVEEIGREEPRTREEILKSIWESRGKKEILNFVGADNVESPAFEIRYVGQGTSCLMTVDRTNYLISFYVDGTLDKAINYKTKTIGELVDEINALADYTANLDPTAYETTPAANLMPEFRTEIKGGVLVCTGTDVHAVIWNTQAPGQFKMEFDGRGSDRIQVSLREV